MARVISEWPQSGRESKAASYDKYLDGQIWELSKDDANGLAITLKTLRMSIYQRGRSKNIAVKTMIVDDGKKLIVQAVTNSS